MGTRHTDRVDMQCKVIFPEALSVSTPSELYTYILPRTELFHSDCLSELSLYMHGIYCLCEQTAKVDRSHYNNSLNHHKLIRHFNLFQPYIFSKFSDRLYTSIVKPLLYKYSE